jgi:hypothetical protein
MNFAAATRAPLVCVVENNQWAYSTPVQRQVPLRDLADRAKAYGIPGMIVDGNDAVAVYETAKEAVERCRAGEGPILIEAKTMRMRGHAQHDPAEYVPKPMFEYWKARDPLALYEAYLTEHKLWDAKTRKEIEARIEREIDEDREFAENSPFPPPELAEQGVYCDGCHTIEADWKRPKAEVMPPKSSVEARWIVEDFGALGFAPEAEAGDSAPLRAVPLKTQKAAKTAAGSGNGARAAKPAAAAKNSKSRPAKAPVRVKGRR